MTKNILFAINQDLIHVKHIQRIKHYVLRHVRQLWNYPVPSAVVLVIYLDSTHQITLLKVLNIVMRIVILIMTMSRHVYIHQGMFYLYFDILPCVDMV